MAISRRDFFADAFGKAVRHIPEIIPDGICNLLGIKKDNPMSADEAAFLLVNTRRKKSPPKPLTDNFPPDNAVHSFLQDKMENG